MVACNLPEYRYNSQTALGSGGFRPGQEGHRPQYCSRPSSFMAIHIFAQITQFFGFICVFKFYRSGQICGFHWTFKNQKCFSLMLWGVYSADCQWANTVAVINADYRYVLCNGFSQICTVNCSCLTMVMPFWHFAIRITSN